MSRRPAVLFLSPLVLAACAPMRYPSLGIDGLNEENAPYVAQRVHLLQTEIAALTRDVWRSAVHVAVSEEQPKCGKAHYDGVPGNIAADATVAVERFDCETNAFVDNASIRFEMGPDGSAPTWEKFTARVQYQGSRSEQLFVDATFKLDFVSKGGSEPGTFDAATWRIMPAVEGHFDISSPVMEGEAALASLRCQYAESHTQYVSLDTAGCDFVMLDGQAATPLVVSTPKIFKTRIASGPQHPFEGMLRVQDVDEGEMVMEVLAPTGDTILLRTYAIATSGDQTQVNLTWDQLASASLPERTDDSWL